MYECALESFSGVISILEMLINTVIPRRPGSTSSPQELPADQTILSAIEKLTKDINEL